MTRNNPRKAVAMVEARKQARALVAEFAERQQNLLDSAEQFLLVRESTDQELAAITTRIDRLNDEAQLIWQRGRVNQARVVGRMRDLGARESEITTRLGVERGEIRRLLAEAETSNPDPGPGWAAHPNPEPRSAAPGPEAMFAPPVHAGSPGDDAVHLL